MNQLRFYLLWSIASLLSLSAHANGKSMFDLFKSLKGSWSIQESEKQLPIEMNYDLGSRDSVVTEQFGKELSVFYVNGNELWMTHYCNRGNQPRLKLSSSSTTKKLEFDIIDISNLEDHKAPHVQRIIYELTNPTRIELELVWKVGSQSKSEKYILS